MDKETINYFSKNAATVTERYESVVSSLSKSFGEAFKPKSKLLDIGSGSGRDLALLTTLGHECFGVDATPEFVELSQSIHPEINGKVLQAALPNFEPPFGGDFDGVLCSAVLMHIPESELVPAAVSIKRCLRLQWFVQSFATTLQVAEEWRGSDTHTLLNSTYICYKRAIGCHLHKHTCETNGN